MHTPQKELLNAHIFSCIMHTYYFFFLKLFKELAQAKFKKKSKYLSAIHAHFFIVLYIVVSGPCHLLS